jgi:cellobiose phosphorylase
LARNAWLSGTASWCYQAATQWILGIRAEYGGLRIDPCIPSTWKGFKAVRRYRGKTVNVTVHNPDGVCKGVVKTSINGKPAAGNLIPVDIIGTDLRIEIYLGKGQ